MDIPINKNNIQNNNSGYKDNNFVQISTNLTNPPLVISDINASRCSKRAINIQSISTAHSIPNYILRFLLLRAIESQEQSLRQIHFDTLSSVYKPNLYNIIHRKCLENQPLTNIGTLKELLFTK
uniref:Wsv432-like protein n=1 Tax=Trachysalambria curvirostris majanivirus TaxID=2984281 RepID=A0A9C7BNE3_9VIRU|nr:MAG: wsv432-like protein [Trachysalambria curvirostris majanivirus]